MEGTFKGWLREKTFGFIAPSDGSPDVFLHQSKIAEPSRCNPGARISFEVEESGKGRTAVDARLIETANEESLSEVCTGQVKFWNERGFGFVNAGPNGADVFIHTSALPQDEEGYLCEGDVIEFQATEGKKGLEARNVRVIGREAASDHLTNFADMGAPGWVERLADLAEPEPWEYKNAQGAEPLPILRSYVRHTFRRLEEMPNGIGVSVDNASAAFNTGLVTANQEEIYAQFRLNRRANRQQWVLSGFRKASDWDFIDKFGGSPPPLAMYFDDPSILLFDRRCELYISIDHVLENIDRFPVHLRDNAYVARQLLLSAEATTKKRVYRNYKAAIPQFYRDRGREGGVQLLLPICLQNPSIADLALVVAKNEAGNAYRGSTVLTLDMAYNNARLLARPDTEWLQP